MVLPVMIPGWIFGSIAINSSINAYAALRSQTFRLS